MSEDGLHPFESILRLCEAAAPEPWYPRLFAKENGVDPRELGQSLEELWHSGLIERADGGPEKGPAITLTREGQRVLFDPDALQRLRAGLPVSRYDRGAIVRQAMTGRGRALVTTLILLVNVAVFTWGYFAARAQRIDNDFLRGGIGAKEVFTPEDKRRQEAFLAILDKSGYLAPQDLLDGEWWRLLTSAFVHFGILHLLMNLVFLYLAGRFVERMWGHFRFLMIYLSGVLGTSCLAVAHNLGGGMGASGAVGGLLGAEIIWFLFNRRYLPRAVLRQVRTTFLINVVLLVLICSYKDVSKWGQIGGATSGALTALLLQLHRFGPPVWRWLAITGFIPMVWYGHYAIEHSRQTNPAWMKVEDEYFESRLLPLVKASTSEAQKVYQEKIAPIADIHPSRRDQAKVALIMPILNEQQRELSATAKKLAHAGPFLSHEAEDARKAGRDYASAMAEWFTTIEYVLELGEKRTDKDRQNLQRQQENVEEKQREWKSLLE
jgi:rhomboid protease GluP